MIKENKSTGKVPNLRFPGFEGEWAAIKLGNASEKINSGKTPLGGESTYLTEGVLFIRSQNINNDRLELENSTFISAEVNAGMKNSVVKANDILLNITGASLGRSCVVPKDFETGNVNQHVCIIRLRAGYNPRFIQPILASSKGQAVFESLQTGSGREGLNFESIRKIELNLPTIYEQTKIAKFLNLIDHRIQTQNKILQYYQSLIQNLRESLFKQKIRFKGNNGSPFPRWEICKLKDIAERVARKNSDNNQNVLTISAQYGLVSQLDFFNKSVSAKNVEGYYLLKKGDFAYNKSYSTGYPMGAIKRLKSYNQGIVSTLYICFRFNEKANQDFMEHYFESQIQNNELEKIAQEGARNHGLLNVGVLDFFNIEIQLPSFEEQIEIAKLLSALNKRVNLQKDIFDKLKRQKSYLLQNLFI